MAIQKRSPGKPVRKRSARDAALALVPSTKRPAPPLCRFRHPDEAEPLELAIAVAGSRLLLTLARMAEHNDFIERILRASGALLVWSDRLLGEVVSETKAGRRQSIPTITFDDDGDVVEVEEDEVLDDLATRRWPALVCPDACDSLPQSLFRKLNVDRSLRRQLAESTLAWAKQATAPGVPALRNAVHAASAFQLGDPGRQLVELIILCELNSGFEEALQQVEFGKRHELVQFLARYCRCDTREMARLLALDGPMVRLGLIPDDASPGSLSGLLSAGNPLFSQSLVNEHATVESFLDSFLLLSAPAKLGEEDTRHLSDLKALAVPLLRSAAADQVRGINLMFYGPPGTGKTELARLLAQDAGLRLYEVRFSDVSGKSLSAKERLASLVLTLQALRERAGAAVLLDEAEDVFSCCEQSHSSRSTEDRELSKAWITRLLENNEVPVLWTSNHVRQMDPAVLRRFSVMYRFADLPRAVTRRLASKYLGDMSLPQKRLEQIAELPTLSPAQLETAARAVSMAQPQDEAATWSLLKLQLNQARRVVRQVPLIEGRDVAIAYDVTCLNVRGDVSAEDVLSGLARNGRGALCFHGLPGTGKTEFARHLAEKLGRELMAKTGSDLLSMWLGQTEQNIANMFDAASDRADEVVLLLDEADTFLMDRSQAKASWERSQTNEFLARMESFPGIFVCTTNLFERLDPAVLRRFQFRLEFQGLLLPQACRLFASAFGRPPNVEESSKLQQLAGRVVPADFANVARQLAFMGRTAETHPVMERLQEECRVRQANNVTTRPMGFVH